MEESDNNEWPKQTVNGIKLMVSSTVNDGLFIMQIQCPKEHETTLMEHISCGGFDRCKYIINLPKSLRKSGIYDLIIDYTYLTEDEWKSGKVPYVCVSSKKLLSLKKQLSDVRLNEHRFAAPNVPGKNLKFIFAIGFESQLILYGPPVHLEYWLLCHDDLCLSTWIKGRGMPSKVGVYELILNYQPYFGDSEEDGIREYQLIKWKRLLR